MDDLEFESDYVSPTLNYLYAISSIVLLTSIRIHFIIRADTSLDYTNSFLPGLCQIYFAASLQRLKKEL